MDVKIVTDSTCDLPVEVAKNHDITVIPCYINLKERSYQDGVDMSRQEFYERLPTFNPLPTTSAPGSESFSSVYRHLAAQGARAVISIHVSSTWSSVANVASLAAREIKEIPVAVIDSGQVSLGLGLITLAAARAAQAGRSLAEIKEIVTGMLPRVWVYAALDTLTYLQRGGRVSRLMSSLGSLLQIKPVLRIHNGVIEIEKMRTFGKAVQRVVDRVRELGPLEQLSYVHSHAIEKLENLRRQAQSLFPNGDPSNAPLIGEVTPAIGVHAGPGAVGLVGVTAP
jgi:DegV family protein with EDD domain